MPIGLFKNGKTSSVVSIDIGSKQMKVVELEKKGGEVHVKNIGYTSTPPESVVAKEIIDRDVIAEEIRNLLDKLKISNNYAVTAVGGKNLIIKNFLISPSESHEIEERIVEEAQKVLPFDIETVFWDYWILPPREGSEDIPVYIVATRQETVYMIEDSLKFAGLELRILDAAPLSLINTVKFNYNLDPNRNYLIVDIGFEGSSFITISNGIYYDHQDGDFSVKKYIESLTRFMNISYEEAFQYLFDSELPSELSASFETIVNGLNQSLADEIQRYLSISGLDINTVFLTGGGVNIKNILEPLKTVFPDYEFVIVNPLKNVKDAAEIEEKFDLSEKEQRLFSLAIGAGLRGLEIATETLINLSPHKKVAKKIKIPPIVGNLIAPLIVLASSAIFVFLMNHEQNATYALLQRQKQEIEQEKKLLGDKLRIMQEIDKKKQELSQKVNVIKEITKDRAFYLEVLNDINRNIPPNIWLSEIKEETEGGTRRFLISGGAFTSVEVSNFMKRLSASKNLWEKVDLIFMKKNEFQGAGYLTFQIVLYPKIGGETGGPQS